jgi:hypothetical protein
MTLDEALYTLGTIFIPKNMTETKNQLQAITLAIQALQFFKGAQLEAGGYHELHLQGETPEQP